MVTTYNRDAGVFVCLFVCALGLPIGKYRDVMHDWWLQIVTILFQTSIEHSTESKVNDLIVYLVNVSILYLFHFALRRQMHTWQHCPLGSQMGRTFHVNVQISEYHKTSQITYLNFCFPKQKTLLFFFTIILCWFHSVLRTKAIFKVSDLFWNRIIESMEM